MFSEIIKVTQLQNVLIKETVHFGFQNFFFIVFSGGRNQRRIRQTVFKLTFKSKVYKKLITGC